MVNDLTKDIACNVNIKILDLTGKVLNENTEEFCFVAAGSEQLMLTDNSKKWLNQNAIIQFSWNDVNGNAISRDYVNKVSDYTIAAASDVSLQIEEIDKVNKTAVLRITNKRFVRNFWVSSEQFGVNFDSNFLNFLPGEHLIEISYEELPKLGELKMMWM